MKYDKCSICDAAYDDNIRTKSYKYLETSIQHSYPILSKLLVQNIRRCKNNSTQKSRKISNDRFSAGQK
jgi:hypothetical protein